MMQTGKKKLPSIIEGK